MRNPPPFREAVALWFAEVSGEALKAPKFTDSEIHRRTGVARTTLDRIRDETGDVDEATLEKLAGLYKVQVPRIAKALQVEPETLQEERKPLDLIGQAQVALERAAGLLRRQAIEPPEGGADAIAEVHRKTKGGGPDGKGKGRRAG